MMKLCPGCQREVVDDAKVCECGLRFDEIAPEPIADEARRGEALVTSDSTSGTPDEAASERRPSSVYDSGEIDLDELGLDEEDLDEADLDSQEIDVSEADLDKDSTVELVVGADDSQVVPAAGEQGYSRREALTRRAPGPPAIIIAAHAIIIIAAACIFYYKSRGSGASYDEGPPDFNGGRNRSYITRPNTAARQMEEILIQLPLSCHIREVVKESYASHEASILLRLHGDRPVGKLRECVETDSVRAFTAIMSNLNGLRTLHVTAQAKFSGGWEDALVVTFDRKKLGGGKKKPQEILLAFSARYHPMLTRK
jgi:hypothetical protein